MLYGESESGSGFEVVPRERPPDRELIYFPSKNENVTTATNMMGAHVLIKAPMQKSASQSAKQPWQQAVAPVRQPAAKRRTTLLFSRSQADIVFNQKQERDGEEGSRRRAIAG